jgi:MCM OB domain/MCM P-loop domain
MESSDEEEEVANREVVVEATPLRPVQEAPRRSSTGSNARFARTPGPAAGAASSVPATPFGNNSDYSMVPATPAALTNNVGGEGSPLTPLSELEDQDDEEQEEGDNAASNMAGTSNNNNNDDDDDDPMADDDEEEGGRNPTEPVNNNDEFNNDDDNPLFMPNGQHELPLVRGTTINIPTAAAAFTDFLKNFRSLARARRGGNNGDTASDSEEDEEHSSDNNAEPPLYMERLKSLLTRGAIYAEHDGDHQEDNNSISPATSSLDIDTMHIYYHSEACQRFYQQLIEFPMELVPLMDLVVRRELETLANQLTRQNELDETPHIPSVQVRPYNLRKVSNIRSLDPVAMDNLLSIKGMVVRISPIIPDLKVAHFTCTICGNDVQVIIDRGRIKEPNSKCPKCSINNSYQLVHNRSIFANKQLVRLQETPDEVPAGQTPASVISFCFDDLVDCVKPGDKVEVTGVLRAQPVRVNPKISKVKSIYKTYLDVIHFKRINGMEANRNRDEERVGREGGGMTSRFTPQRIDELKALSKRHDIYDILVASLAPSIWELDNVKRGVLCMLFGGSHVRVKKGYAEKRRKKEEKENRRRQNQEDHDSIMDDEDEDETEDDDLNLEQEKLHKRGDINILLCGDPGECCSRLRMQARSLFLSSLPQFTPRNVQIAATELC